LECFHDEAPKEGRFGRLFFARIVGARTLKTNIRTLFRSVVI
jgi:hypothetical protein